jgi:hypothetical protein
MKVLRQLDKLANEALVEVGMATGSNPTMLKMVGFHLTKPWIPDYHSMLLSPLKSGLENFFKVPVIKLNNKTWYYPSTYWWMIHAKASHPPNGSGCDPAVHTQFLSPHGKNAEFLYAAVLRDGTLHILDSGDFVQECAWWKKNF